jgi:SAM-dependent methyltransferase
VQQEMEEQRIMAQLLDQNLLGFELGPDGIYWKKKTNSDEPRISFPDDAHNDLVKFEEESFWFLHRNKVITHSFSRLEPTLPIFDIGGGNGFVTKELQDKYREVALLEPFSDGCINARTRGITNIFCGTLKDLLSNNVKVGAAGFFDVIEHIEDDEKWLCDVHEILSPDGKIYLTVPAYMWLWSKSDEMAGHFRRYSLKTIRTLLEKCGFHIEYSSYFFSMLPIAIFLSRVIPSKSAAKENSARSSKPKHRQHVVKNRLIRKFMNIALNAELFLMRMGISIPFGSSLIIVGKKSNS